MSQALGALRDMLVNDAAVVAAVPPSRIVAAEIPQDTNWPVILLLHASTQRAGNAVVGVGQELLTTTIECIPIAKGYAEMATLVALVEAACHGKRGVFAGVQVSSCLRTAQGSDDFIDEQDVWARPVVFDLLYTRP